MLLLVLKLLLGDEAPGFMETLLVALGMAAVNFVCGLLLGIWGLIPIVLIDGLILMFFCHLAMKQAIIALAIFMVYKIGITIAFTMMLG